MACVTSQSFKILPRENRTLPNKVKENKSGPDRQMLCVCVYVHMRPTKCAFQLFIKWRFFLIIVEKK